MWRRAVVAASSLFSCVVLLAALLTTDSARGADLPPPPPPPPPPVVPVYKAPDPILSVFYTGGAFNWVHHTGYVPNSTQADTAQYTVGFKVFGGYRFTRQNSVEVTYHYLGQVNIEGLPIPTTERAWAISGSFVHVSPPFSQWIGPGPWNDYLHAFVRLGLAYKHVEQSSALGTIDEGFLSGVIGAGIQAQFTPQWFGRIEYEFLSTAIGGPPQSVPGFKGLYQVKIGGTNRVDNVMNTPIAITLGYNF